MDIRQVWMSYSSERNVVGELCRETRLPCCTEQVLVIGQHGSVNEVYAFNDKATVDCRGWLPSLGSSCSRDTPSIDNTLYSS